MTDNAPDIEMTITVERLRLRCRHGAGPLERVVGQEFEVTASLRCLVGPWAWRDDADLASTVSYADVVAEVRREMERPSRLLENVAWRLKEALCLRFGGRLVGGSLTVAKLTPPIAGAQMRQASVQIKW